MSRLMDQLDFKRPFLMAGGFCDDWPCRSWDMSKLEIILGDKPLLCRLSEKSCDRRMETECFHIEISMRNFCEWLRNEAQHHNPLAEFPRSKYCCYIDYKYMKDLFQDNPDVFSDVRWSSFGLPGFDGSDSTMWIGSEGANTPCHQDSYGFNLITQIYGRKLWILFPPKDAQCLYPTRVPYEESSVFSAVNVRSPDVLRFPLLKNSHPVIVTLNPGQTLYVPRHWWHYVQSLEPSISVNVWVPLQEDVESRYHEAVTRCLASSLIKDLTAREDNDEDDQNRILQNLLNPTETLSDSQVNLTLLKTSLSHVLEEEHMALTSSTRPFESPSRQTVMGSSIRHSNEHLRKFASAVGSYPVNHVSSPLELNPSKRTLEEEITRDCCSSKRPRFHSHCSGVEDDRTVEKSSQCVETKLDCRQIFCIDSCSSDVYLKHMKTVCNETGCSCYKYKAQRGISDFNTLLRKDQADSEQSREKHVGSKIPETSLSGCEISKSTSPMVFKSDKCETNLPGLPKSFVGVIPSCSIHTKIDDQNNSQGDLTGSIMDISRQKQTSCSHQDGFTQNGHALKPEQDMSTQPVQYSTSREALEGTLMACKAPVGKEAVQHGQGFSPAATHKGIWPGPDFSQTEVAEMFLASVLHPDVIKAIAVKFKEQCVQMLKNRDVKEWS